MKEITVDAVVENLETVTIFVNEILDAFLCPAKIKMQMDIAIDELFTNISRYAYPDKVGQVTIKVQTFIDTNNICITFIDSGIPYNPLEEKAPNTTLSVEERKIGGLGIYMVKKSMDEMTYEYCEGKNQVVIKKFIT